MRGVALLAALVAAESPLYSYEADDLKSGLPVRLKYYEGRVLLFVNVATQCGYTDAAYSQLNTLHERYHAQGLDVLGFPCNQFGAQEPGGSKEILDFAQMRKRAKWDLFRKVEVNGPGAHPIFKWLKGEGEDDCVDHDGSCTGWADAGECDKNRVFMEARCQRSCGLCPGAAAGEDLKWNFEAFLVTRSGQVHTRWPTGTDLTSRDVGREIEALLAGGKDEL
jgi:glutathione peroxidase